jgi:hypothetical protein
MTSGNSGRVANKCVSNRPDGQELCLNLDSICVRRRRKSLIFNARCDSIYVRRQLVMWDISPVNSDTNPVKLGHYCVNRRNVRPRDCDGKKRYPPAITMVGWLINPTPW